MSPWPFLSSLHIWERPHGTVRRCPPSRSHEGQTDSLLAPTLRTLLTLNFEQFIDNSRQLIKYIYQWFPQKINSTFPQMFIFLANEIVHLELTNINTVL